MSFYLRYLRFFILLVFFCATAQDNPAADIAEDYANYFHLKKEGVYLHLNKTSFLPKESLWFAAYVYYSDLQEPCRATSTLSVAIYNDHGKLLKEKLVFLDEGTGSGYFDLDKKKFPPGTYYLRALTPYLKNFKEDHSFVQKIKVVGATEKLPAIERKYDLQLLPESGHLLENTENTVAVKLIDNSGKGVRFSKGELLNSDGEAIKLFASNRFGMGKFQLKPEAGKDYRIRIITPEGEELEQQVPTPEPVGITLSAGTTNFGQYFFSIKTNEASLAQIKDKKFVLAIHQEGKMRAFNFSFKDSTEVRMKLPSNTVYTGTNIATVFDEEHRPLAERLIFNRNGILRRRVNATFKKQEFDSLVLQLNSRDELLEHSLSVSVLPSGTEAYEPQHDIFSTFYLKPYVKGNLENGGYYFSTGGNLSQKNQDLDLLLITQGWSQYSWEEIFDAPPKEIIPHQLGLTVKGKVYGKIKDDHRLVINSRKANLIEEIAVSENGDFELPHAFIADSTAISFTLVRKKNNKTEIPSVSFEVLPKFKADSTFSIPDIRLGEHQTFIRIPEGFTRDAEVLDTVFLEEKYKTKEGEMIYLKENSRSTKTEISEREEQAFYYITDYLKFHGFRVERHDASIMIFSKRANIQLLMKPEQLVPIVTIDGVRLPKIGKYPDFRRLADMTTKEVKSIKINKSGAGLGFGGAGGWIEIETRKEARKYDSSTPSVNDYIANNGYDLDKKFYTPKYSSYNNSYFEKLGTYGWFPHLRLQKGQKTIKILNTLQPDVRLFIEGITQGGYLISEEVLVNTKEPIK